MSLEEHIQNTGILAAPRVKAISNRGVRSFGQQLQASLDPTHNGGSWHFACMSEIAYAAVRACIRHQGAAGYTHNAIAFAPSTSIASVTPSGSWVVGAFAGSASIAVPARLAANVPSTTYTDWASVPAVAHSSGFYPIHTRSYIATGPFSYSGASTTISQWKESAASALMRNRYALCAVAAGDFVSSNQAGFVSYDDTINLSPVLELEFLTAQQVMTVCGVGDSIMWGGGGALDMVGAGHLACAAVSTSTRPVFWQNAGVPSTTTSQFIIRLQKMMAAGSRPQVLLYQAFSRNDGTPTAATIAINRFNLYQALDLCAQYGMIPIIDTGTAETTAAWNSTADNLRKGFVTEILALRTQGVLVLDSDSVLSNAATPARYGTGLSTDGTHPNDAGQALVSTLLQPLLLAAAKKIFA